MGFTKYVVMASVLFILLAGAVAAERLLLRTDALVDREDPVMYVSLGNYLYAQGYADQAITVLTRAYDLIQDPVMASNAAFYLHETGEDEGAEELWLQAAAQGHVGALTSLSVLYHEQDRTADAIAVLEELIVLEPGKPNHYYDLAINLADQYRKTGEGDLDRIIALFGEADSLESGFGHAMENIAVLERIRDASEEFS